MTPRGLVLVGLLLVLGAVNLQIAEKERLLARGETMRLRLSWDDDRSMMQGDYLRLDYALSDVPLPPDTPRDGRLVVRLDAHQVAQFVRLDDGTPLAQGEHLLRYRIRRGQLRLGTDAYFIQEGRKDQYAAARYGEFRVDEDGTSVLTGLRDGALRPLD